MSHLTDGLRVSTPRASDKCSVPYNLVGSMSVGSVPSWFSLEEVQPGVYQPWPSQGTLGLVTYPLCATGSQVTFHTCAVEPGKLVLTVSPSLA